MIFFFLIAAKFHTALLPLEK